MSKSIKIKNNTYLDSGSITHGRNKLSDELYDSGWQTFSLESGFSHYQYGALKYRKKNGIVTIIGGIEITSNTDWLKLIANIPDGFRPLSEINVVCRNANGGYAIIGISDRIFWLTADSGIVINNTVIFISASYISA